MDKGNKEKLIAKIISVILAFGLWLYVTNVENPTRTSQITGIPVKIENEDVLKDSNLALTPGQDLTVDLSLEGPSSEVYGAKKSDFTVVLDLNSYALKEGENVIPVKLVDYPSGVNIKNDGILSVKVNVEPLVEKEVKVTSNVKTSFKSGYKQSSLNVSPEVVKISGAKSVVDRVKSAALVGSASDIGESYEGTFKLSPMDSNGNEVQGVSLSEEEGTLTIGSGIKKEVKVVTNYKGSLPNGIQLDGVKLDSDKVTITGSKANIDKIQSISTEDIDLSNIKETTTLKLKYILPSGVNLVGNYNYVNATVTVKSVENNTEDKADNSNSDDAETKTIDNISVSLSDGNDTSFIYEAEKISITVTGKKTDLDKLTQDNVKASASAAELKEVGQQEVELNVSLVNAGSTVKIINKPDKVKVTIKKV